MRNISTLALGLGLGLGYGPVTSGQGSADVLQLPCIPAARLGAPRPGDSAVEGWGMMGYPGKGRLWVIAVLLVGLLLAACRGPAWEENPRVKAARIACAGLRAREHYDCVVEQATSQLEPEVCHLAIAGLDGLCLQAVYKTANDPAMCDRIYLKEVAAQCQEWFTQSEPESQP